MRGASRQIRIWIGALLTTALAFSAPALGAPRKGGPVDARSGATWDATTRRAKAAFDKAEHAYRRADFRTALRYYQKALELKRLPALLFNIGQCHRQLGELKKAIFFYKLYLSEKPDAPNRDEVQRWIGKLAASLQARARERARLGRVSVVTRPAGASVWVDRAGGPAQATTPTVIRLRPGSHVLVLRAPGHREVHRKVVVPPGQALAVEVTLQPLRRTRRYYHQWWFWAGVSSTALLAAAAAGTGTIALQMQDKWDRTQGQPNVSYDFEARSKALRISTDVLIGAAVLTAATTLIGAILYERRGRERPTATRLLPACGPRGCALVVTGRF